jgi:hypothetical protein
MFVYSIDKDEFLEVFMSFGETKGTIEWEGRRITVEGPPDFVSAELERFRNAGPGAPPTVSGAASAGSVRPTTDAAFVALKRPRDHYERIAVLAVRLKESGTAEFDGDDMRRAYLRAGVKPPKAIKQALVDTKRHRDYIEPSAARGKYRLTNFGEDFVQFELPKSEL